MPLVNTLPVLASPVTKSKEAFQCKSCKNVKLKIIATNEDTERHLRDMGYEDVINPAETIASEIVNDMGVKA